MTLLLTALACGGDDGPRPDPDPTTPEESAVTHSGTTTDTTPFETAGTGDTGATHTADTGAPAGIFDCATMVGPPTAYDPEIPGARGYHGLVFDDQGNVFGSDLSGNLLRADAYGATTILVPGLGWTNQLVFLPDGYLAVAGDWGVLKVDPATGGSVPLADNHAYGLILGPDGMLYAALEYHPAIGIARIDPTTGESTVWLRQGELSAGNPRVIAFSLDYTRMFIGTYSGWSGRIYEVPVDANLDPTGPPTVFTDGVGDGSYHDTMGVDVCGYLYVANYGNSSLYRIHPVTGAVQRLHDARGNSSNYGHGMAWGRGYGGFSDMAIYLAKPYDRNKVSMMTVNVPARDWEGGYAINLPQ